MRIAHAAARRILLELLRPLLTDDVARVMIMLGVLTTILAPVVAPAIVNLDMSLQERHSAKVLDALRKHHDEEET